MALKFDQKKLDKFKEDELADKRIFTKLQEEVCRKLSKVDQAETEIGGDSTQ
jgi:plasmid maintenance system killer protein